ncbi:urease accessory protein UreD [Salinibacterium sp. NSLL150]|uniref:urease accessory protein UreD n=1 Tax=unclassified Salinibacterium TaxID=2632331 RepID=UPI0018CFD42B|nr:MULTISPECIES: urease accessory protein UreD [unclassified Salinibacterium]MBH0098807.1 urease accessory protein UreD [Salinibacterium sp. NSLL35]MBH0101562.1 urease accessory protein UreD [Salinibacterium sp. NSLL150]MBH0104321.1 urease accessory protein UreD [Salinibacterium sp. NSLL16]MBH0107082.1 urease accessory protein UreD [Salinibacterium sp. NSLL17]
MDLRAGILIPRLISCTDQSADVALVAGGALLLGGDTVAIEITVGAGCLLTLEDIGGMVAYDGEGQSATMTIQVRLQAGAQLSWATLPFIIADGACVERVLDVELDEGAVALIRETLVLGREGEKGGRVVTRTSVSANAVPVLIEQQDFDGSAPVWGHLGAERVMDTVLLAGVRAPASYIDLNAVVLDFEEPGGLARWLGRETHLSPLDTVWRDWALA